MTWLLCFIIATNAIEIRSNVLENKGEGGDPDKIRTCDLQIRNLSLYSFNLLFLLGKLCGRGKSATVCATVVDFLAVVRPAVKVLKAGS